MIVLLYIGVGWYFVALLLALLIGRAIRIRDLRG